MNSMYNRWSPASNVIGRPLNVRVLRHRLAQQGIVEIRDFANPTWARIVHDFLRERPRGDWTVAVKTGDEVEHYRDVPRSRASIEVASRRARGQLTFNSFCYRFRRTFDDHDELCDCVECQLRTQLAAPPMLGLLQDLGMPVTEPAEVFASAYRRGDFLSPHHDQDNGEVGFVLNLTSGWQPQWGGLLLFLAADWHQVRRVCVPTYNSLCLFRLSLEQQVPHMVTQVVSGVRYAVTGWFR